MIAQILGIVGLLMSSQFNTGKNAEIVPMKLVHEKYRELLIEALDDNDVYHEQYGEVLWVKSADLEKIDQIQADIFKRYASSAERTINIHSYYLKAFEEKLLASKIQYTIVEWDGVKRVVLDDQKDFTDARILKFEVTAQLGPIPREELEKQELPIFR